MSRNPIKTHPVDGYTNNSKLDGNNKSIYCVPHNCMPGLNTYFISKINNINDAVQYYSVPNQFNLPMPYIPFSEIDLSNICSLDSIAYRLLIQLFHIYRNKCCFGFC